MIPMTLAAVAAAVDGRLTAAADPAATITGAVTADSRAVEPGGLFAAFAGERADGHDFAPAAVAAGAAAVLGARDLGLPGVVVDDVLVALGRLAHAVTAACPGLAPVALTGSSGKTTTKDLIAHVLARAGQTVAPPGSFNNELGLPLTALRVTAETRYLVLEMGARGPGHLRYLCGIVRPRIGLVLNVGTAHLGEFGSREGIAAAKGELVEALPADGVAVLNADDPFVAAMAARTAARVVRFGTGPDADVRADDVSVDGTGRASFMLRAAGASVPVSLRLRGEHQVSNALAAAAAALECGLDPGEVAAALSTAEAASRWRMEVTDRPDGVTIVNDAYNANPDSVRAALRTLASMSAGRRSWAVLGVMAELGGATDAEHESVGRAVARAGVDRLVVVGEDAGRIHSGAALEGFRGEDSVVVPDMDAAAELLARELRAGDVVLLKASRAAGLERLALELAAATAGRVGA